MIAEIAAQPTYRLIGQADINAAIAAANNAAELVQDAWERVEEASREAVRLEAECDRLHEVARRLRLQIGFRIVQ